MKVNFRYPALVTSSADPASSAGRRVVAMTGEAEIREFGSADIPVAAVLGRGESTVREPGMREYRHFEGRFYREAYHDRFTGVYPGLDRTVAHAICETLLTLSSPSSAIAPGGSGARARDILWWLWNQQRQADAHRDGEAGFPPSFWDNAKDFSSDKHDCSMLHKWNEVATSYMSSLITIDGSMFIPVAEPMLMSDISDDTPSLKNWCRYEDATCYTHRSGRFKDLPGPYGNSGIVILQNEHYWDYCKRFHSLPEVAATPDIAKNWDCEVLMPEAFTTDHIGLGLDRWARLAACMYDFFGGEIVPASGSLKAATHYFKKIITATKQKAEHQHLDGMVDDLEALLKELSAFSPIILGANKERLGPNKERATLVHSLRDALDRWHDRPIEAPQCASVKPSFSMHLR